MPELAQCLTARRHIGVALPGALLAQPGMALLVLAMAPTPSPEQLAEFAHRARQAAPDLDGLLALARRHGLLHPVIERLKAVPGSPALVSDSWLQEARRLGQRAAILTLELQRLLASFSAQALPVLVLKGPVTSLLAYGAPTRRAFGDLDLLVKPGDLDRAHQLLVAAGFTPKGGASPPSYLALQERGIAATCELAYQGPNFEVDLHWSLYRLPFLPTPPGQPASPWEAKYPMSGLTVPSLSVEGVVLHLACHAIGHHGLPLNCLADLAAILARHPELNWAQIQAMARATGNRRRLALALNLTSLYTGVALAPGAEAAAAWPSAASDLRRLLAYQTGCLLAYSVTGEQGPANRGWRAMGARLRLAWHRWRALNWEEHASQRWAGFWHRLWVPKTGLPSGWRRPLAVLCNPARVLAGYLSKPPPGT